MKRIFHPSHPQISTNMHSPQTTTVGFGAIQYAQERLFASSAGVSSRLTSAAAFSVQHATSTISSQRLRRGLNAGARPPLRSQWRCSQPAVTIGVWKYVPIFPNPKMSWLAWLVTHLQIVPAPAHSLADRRCLRDQFLRPSRVPGCAELHVCQLAKPALRALQSGADAVLVAGVLARAREQQVSGVPLSTTKDKYADLWWVRGRGERFFFLCHEALPLKKHLLANFLFSKYPLRVKVNASSVH